MSDSVQTGWVQTVLGLIKPGELGVTLTHEHLLCDLTPAHRPPDDAEGQAIYHSPVSQETLGYIRHYAAQNLDNTRLLDIETAISEVALYTERGGSTLVDATSVGIGRDPQGLAHISRQTGLNIVMGSSHYVSMAHPPDMDTRSEDELVEEIVRDVTQGVGDTAVRAGIIGEVGCSWPLDDNERKVLRASARAQALTGAPLLVHPGRDEKSPLDVLEVLNAAGAELGRTIMGHLDRTVFDRATLRRIAESGCYLEWDLFGREQSYYSPEPKIDMPGDAQRMDDIAWTCAEGYSDRVVVGQDICTKDRLIKYGGHGYSYILSHIAPRMKKRGFDERTIQRILVENPAAVLTFSAPKRGA